MKPLADCCLYAFVDTAFLRGRSAAAVARELCQGGADLVQLRAKELSPGDVLNLGRQIAPILKSANVGFVVNDHWDVARELGADFCHFGQEDYFAGKDNAPTPRPRPPGFGLSTHAPAQAQRALAAAPDYIAIGPVYATGTKPHARPVTLDCVRWAAENVAAPWFAIGGINLANLDDVLEAGATRVCVVSAILNAPDVADACRQFKDRLAPRKT